MLTQWYRFELRRAVVISGRVTDAVTHAPLAGALVEIVNGPAAFLAQRAPLLRNPQWAQQAERLDRRLTRPDGRYYFMDLPAGLYHLRITLPQPAGRYGETNLTGVRVWATREPNGRVKLDPADATLPPI